MSHIVTLTLNPTVDMATSAPRLEPFSKLRCSAPQYDPGGGGINVARVVTRLGGKALAVYPEGGAIGHFLHRLMEREGVASRTVPSRAETRQNITVFEEPTLQQFRFIMPGPSLGKDEIDQSLARVAEALAGASWLVVSGSLPAGAPDRTYADALALARAAGVPAALDASGPALAAALDACPALIKPNLREFRELTGATSSEDGALVEAGRRLIADGKAGMIALTLGPDGALLIAPDIALRANGLPIKPASVVGAGDSFLGAWIHAQAGGLSLSEALRAGVAAGSAALMHHGTELCRAEDVARLAPLVEIRPIG